jgi:peptidoglycan/xylan/chitin deacetylase (PgdA/CDA1 family)
MRALFRPEPRAVGLAASDAVALTFDDGPCPAATPEILDLLGNDGAVATFFMIGERVRKWPELARRIYQEGHQIANHSDRHFAFRSLVPAICLREAQEAREAFRSVVGIAPRFYRPPKGLIDGPVVKALQKAGYSVMTWSKMPGDYSLWHTPARLARRLAVVGPGDIVVLHDGLGLRPAADRSRMLCVLPEFLREMKARGIRLVSVAELVGQPAYFPEAGARPGKG